MRRLLLAVAIAAAGGCHPEPDFYVNGIGIKVETAQPWVTSRDFGERLERAIELVAEYAGQPGLNLAGWVIVVSDEWYVACPGASGGSHFQGCTNFAEREIAVSISGCFCIECTALIHEIMHVAIGDSCHHDERWRDFRGLAEALQTVHPTTTTGGACELMPGAWCTEDTCN